MGSPDFAVPSLLALHEAGHQIVAVYSQPPRPVGRGHAVQPCPVHAAAEQLGLEVRTPTRLRTDVAAQAAFAALDLDAAVLVAYGLIVPAAMLVAPRRGCLNIHASLLPRWRGAAPIQAAILAGDSKTGVTIIRLDDGLDTGPMLLSERVGITSTTTAAVLHHMLARIGARLILRTLEEDPPAVPQPAVGVTYAPKLKREDARIDWTWNAAAVERQVRAFDPWPGTFTQLDGAVMKVLTAVLADGEGDPGVVVDEQLTVACGEGALRLTRVQLAGRAAMDTKDFLRGHPVPKGTQLI
jgi:methionyl-tRNA formyltransferase